MPTLSLHPTQVQLVQAGAIESVVAVVSRIEQERNAAIRLRERRIDEQLVQSFPASDPPGWVQGTAPLPY